jgi:hypothetical protein
MLESVEKFHCGYWNVLKMSTVPVDKHMLENSVSPVVWSCDIHHICWNFASVLVTVYDPSPGSQLINIGFGHDPPLLDEVKDLEA